MLPTELYRQIVGVDAPWVLSNVELINDRSQVLVTIDRDPRVPLRGPVCEEHVPGYDRRRRRWRHLDTCQFPTYVQSDVPRLECPVHGVKHIAVPWAEGSFRFTALFEAFVIEWLKAACIADVARILGLSWSAIARIQQRAVNRGLARRAARPLRYLSVDETSFAKRHQYVTVISDQQTGAVLHVADDRSGERLSEYLQNLNPAEGKSIRTVSMDMWKPYVTAVTSLLPQGKRAICFDRFHIAQHLSRALDAVRRQEHRKLVAQGDRSLSRSRTLWLQHPDRMTEQAWQKLEGLRRMSLKTGRAWSLKETDMTILRYTSRTFAAIAWKRSYSWAIRSRLEPMKKVARTLNDHPYGIINAMAFRRSNALAESINSRIQTVKRRTRGFRSRRRFREAIYFHLGQLDLYPEPVDKLIAHSKR